MKHPCLQVCRHVRGAGRGSDEAAAGGSITGDGGRRAHSARPCATTRGAPAVSSVSVEYAEHAWHWMVNSPPVDAHGMEISLAARQEAQCARRYAWVGFEASAMRRDLPRGLVYVSQRMKPPIEQVSSGKLRLLLDPGRGGGARDLARVRRRGHPCDKAHKLLATTSPPCAVAHGSRRGAATAQSNHRWPSCDAASAAHWRRRRGRSK